jgi:hypothetical protein
MLIPGEIVMVNAGGRRFRAHPTGVRTSRDTFQFRVHIPGVELSMVVQDVSRQELRVYGRTRVPIPIKPAVT